jgi:uncharacterized repeat protein (TIGR01451 family)
MKLICFRSVLLVCMLFASQFVFSQNGIVRSREFSFGIENEAKRIVVTTDNNYVALYYSQYNSNNPNVNSPVVKYDTAFNVIWRNDLPVRLEDMIPTPDGGVIATGVRSFGRPDVYSEEFWIIKLSSTGTIQWQKNYGGMKQDYAHATRQKPNGNYLIIGITNSIDGDVIGKTIPDRGDTWVIELDPSGNLVNQRLLDIAGSDSYTTTIGATPDNGAIVAMTTSIGIQPSDIVIYKLGADLSIQWSRTIGGSAEEVPRSIYVDAAGDYILSGKGNSTNGDIVTTGTFTDGFIMKLDPAGNTKWTKIVAGSYNDEIYSAKPLPGNEIIAVGFTQSDAVEGIPTPASAGALDGILLRLDANGNTIWSRRIGANSHENAQDVTPTPWNSFLICGLKNYTTSGGDFTGILDPAAGGESRAYIMEVKNFSNKIKGIVYLDANNNKIVDAGEVYDAAPVNVTKGSFQINGIPVQGNFSFSLDTGVYVTRLKHEGIFDPTTTGISPKRKTSVLTTAGQSDSFAIRMLPMSLAEDLQVSIRQLTDAWLDHATRYKVTLQNVGGHAIANAQIKIKLDNKVTYQSSERPVSTTIGDTLVFNYTNFSGHASDSFDLVVYTKSLPDIQPGAVTQLVAIAEPYASDFDSIDNKAIVETVISGQNAAISNINFDLHSSDSARFNRTIPYTIFYGLNSKLDSTKGVVRLIKNPNSTFVSAIPEPTSIVNDTITWNFKMVDAVNSDTIVVRLKTEEGNGLQVGDHIPFTAQLRLTTADIAVLSREDFVMKKVMGYSVEPDTITTTLTPPHGLRWTRAYGGSRGEYAYDVVSLPDSGFIVVGLTGSNDQDLGGTRDSTDGFFARFDKDGHEIWKRAFGGNDVDELVSVSPAGANNFYAVGTKQDPNGGSVWIVKFNINGDTLWTKTYGGSSAELAWSVLATDDGGCVFAAQTLSEDGDVHDNEHSPIYEYFPGNLWVVKLDANGVLQWDSCYFGPAHAYEPAELRRTNDNKIALVGTAYAVENFDLVANGLLLVLNNDGTRAMEKLYSKDGLQFRFNSVVVNEDNSFTFAGQAFPKGAQDIDTTYSGLHGQADVWAGQLDNAGNLLWQKFFGGSTGEAGEHITATVDGNYLIAGNTQSNDGNVTNNHSSGSLMDGWLLKIDGTGKLLWQKTIGGTNNEILRSVAELKDLSAMAVGYTSSNNGDIVGYHGGESDILLAKVGVSNFITGRVYIDLNNNGVKDPNEPYFKKGIVNVTGSNRNYSGVVFDGLYQVSVDTGNYTLKFYTTDSAYYNVVPPTANVSFDELSQTATVDFRLVKKAEINDLRLTILPLNIIRPGFTANFRIQYENKGTIGSAPVTVRVKLDPNTTYKSSTIPVSSSSGDTLIWDLAGPDILETASFALAVNVKPPPDVNLNDTLRFYGVILPIEIDSTPLDNIAEARIVVRGAYDPNDKIEVHGNTLPYNFVENDEYLTYVIRFQNTGTDTAFNVYVRDTLSTQFDWNTFEMIDASHPYELSMQGGNILEWYFRDIYLADSNVNEPASHGFIAFRIKPRQDLAIGDSITNDAGIYFDFNLPVQTNLMLSTIGPANALPSTILQFTASWKQEIDAALSWKVTNEYKVNYYEVQHSGNGVQFSAIGQVQATNGQADHSYDFIHIAPAFGINYYRLKIVDIDGKVDYSKIVVLKKETDLVSTLKIYPVPAANEPITILIEGKVKGIGTLSVYSIDGKLITAKQLGIIDQQNYRFTIDANTLGKGVYMLNCTIGDRSYRGKLIIQ